MIFDGRPSRLRRRANRQTDRRITCRATANTYCSIDLSTVRSIDQSIDREGGDGGRGITVAVGVVAMQGRAVMGECYFAVEKMTLSNLPRALQWPGQGRLFQAC